MINKIIKGLIIVALITLWCRVLFLEDAMVKLESQIKVAFKAVLYLKGVCE